MTCDHCLTLQKRVEHLERELGIRRRDQEIAAVVHRLEVSATSARLLLRLYAAGGKWVSVDSLMTVLSTTSYESLKVTITRLREIISKTAIETAPVGSSCYRLSAEGLSKVMAAIEPVEVQRVVETVDLVEDLV